ncbi:MAG: nucleotide exchange factor GrpE [Chloroflexi bacterium]|nr:nucleotide exchange factor GrpE [Chloroflexota bacterium]MCH8897088.1 nucleotide exchange factor GrpE [Chloroflexota bacterium]
MTNEADEVQLSDQDVAGQNFDDQSIDKPKLSAKYEHLSLEEQVAALSNDLGDALKEAEQNRDTAQRAQAEMVNYRKRADEERISLQQYSNSRLIIKLLPVLDELGLAIDHADQNESSNPWLEGVRLIQRKASNLLESEGVSQIEAIGVQFDPLEHEAIGTEETTKCPSGHVAEVVRNGYRLHDRVIQPAQVIVAR